MGLKPSDSDRNLQGTNNALLNARNALQMVIPSHLPETPLLKITTLARWWNGGSVWNSGMLLGNDVNR